MATKEKYIASYRMPVGVDNPPVNMPKRNTPTELFLTEEEVKELKSLIPDIKLVKVKDSTEETSEAEVEAEEAPEEEEEEVQEPAEKQEEAPQANATFIANDPDFPAQEDLLDHEGADLSTVQAVIAHSSSLTEVDGIGKATEEKILKYIQENYADLL